MKSIKNSHHLCSAKTPDHFIQTILKVTGLQIFKII